MFKNKQWHFVFAFIPGLVAALILSLLVLPGCNGGSRGTGGLAVEGIVSRAANGDPVAAATVTLVLNGQSTTTDELGQFGLGLENTPTSVELFVQVGTLQASTLVEGIPASTTVLFLEIAIDEQSGTA